MQGDRGEVNRGVGRVLLLALLIRLVIAPLAVHPADFAALTGWAAALNEGGMASIYLLSDANYPPLGLLALRGAAGLFGLLRPALALDPAGRLWLVCLKLPAILADVGLAWGVGRIAGPGKRVKAVWWIALNPVLIYLSAYWGQLESVYLLPALLAVWSAERGRPGWAGLWLGAAALVKLQGVVIAPAVLLAVWFRSGVHGRSVSLSKLAAGGAAVLMLVFGPYLLMGQGRYLLNRLVAVKASAGWLTLNAHNPWYLLTAGAGNWAFNTPLVLPDTMPLVGVISARAVGVALLITWTLLAVVVTVRSTRAGRWYWLVALLYAGVYLWPTGAHDRYLVGAVVFSIAALAGMVRNRAGAAIAAAFTVLMTLSLLWSAPFIDVPGNVAGMSGMMLSAVMIGVGVWGVVWLALHRPRQREPEAATSPGGGFDADRAIKAADNALHDG